MADMKLITDELRDYALQAVKRDDYMNGLSYDLNRIADNIDIEYQRSLESIDDDRLDELGLMRLPRDAYGDAVRLGDRMSFGESETRTVKKILIDDEGEYWYDEHGSVHGCRCSSHGGKAKVERILLELAYDVTSREDSQEPINIREYANRILKVMS